MSDDKKVKSLFDPNRDTLGQSFQDILEKPRDTVSSKDLSNEMLDEFIKNFNIAVERGRKRFRGDFFIELLNKRERLFASVFSTWHFPRRSCPKATYDQSVFIYSKKDDAVTFLWSIPDKETCQKVKMFPLECDDSERELRPYILDFYDGTLDNKRKEYDKVFKL